MSQFFLGVDGGQSSTTALIADETGLVLGSGQSGPCNHVGAAEGRQKFLSAVGGSLGEACRQASLDPRQVVFESACLGFSGGPADKEALLGELLTAKRLIVTHDAAIALAGATGGEPGIIAIAGTGSIAFGRNAQDRTARAGGWGYIFGDEGGGFDLTRQALRAALRAEEGWGPPTALRAMLLEATGAPDANDLLHRFYTSDYPRPRIASFSRLVEQAAAEGDAVARDILHNAAQQLATITAAVRRQLFESGAAALIAGIGGVFQNEMVRERYRMLVELVEGNRFTPPVYGPAAGALLMAFLSTGLRRQLNGVPILEK